jgi:hypothetical protein
MDTGGGCRPAQLKLTHYPPGTTLDTGHLVETADDDDGELAVLGPDRLEHLLGGRASAQAGPDLVPSALQESGHDAKNRRFVVDGDLEWHGVSSWSRSFLSSLESHDILLSMNQPTPAEAVETALQLRDTMPYVFVLLVGAVIVGVAALGYVRLRRTMREDDLAFTERVLRIWEEHRVKLRALGEASDEPQRRQRAPGDS